MTAANLPPLDVAERLAAAYAGDVTVGAVLRAVQQAAETLGLHATERVLDSRVEQRARDLLDRVVARRSQRGLRTTARSMGAVLA